MVSRPRVSSMRKKMIAQKGDRGSLVSASGYTTKAMPGPVDNTQAWMKTLNHHTRRMHTRTHTDTLAWFNSTTSGVSPSSATCSMGTFNSCAMNPMTEKMTKPANILVALFVHVTIIVSLQGKNEKEQKQFITKIYLVRCHNTRETKRNRIRAGCINYTRQCAHK